MTGGLLIVVAFFHPLILFPASFLFLYFILQSDKNTSKVTLAIAFAVYLAAWYVKFRFYKTSYDTAAMASTNDIVARLGDFFALYSTKMFLKDSVGKFLLLPICFTVTVAYYVWWKKRIHMLLYILFVAGYILLVNTSYPDPGAPRFYMENLYLPISVFIGVPLVFEIGRHCSSKAAIAILLIIVAADIIRVLNVAEIYTSRLNWERDFLNKHSDEKLIVHERHVPSDTLIMTWGTSYEFWLLSTIENKKTASIIINPSLKELIPPPGKSRSFITKSAGYPYWILPASYFIFPDTVSEYKVIK